MAWAAVSPRYILDILQLLFFKIFYVKVIHLKISPAKHVIQVLMRQTIIINADNAPTPVMLHH